MSLSLVCYAGKALRTFPQLWKSPTTDEQRSRTNTIMEDLHCLRTRSSFCYVKPHRRHLRGLHDWLARWRHQSDSWMARAGALGWRDAPLLLQGIAAPSMNQASILLMDSCWHVIESDIFFFIHRLRHNRGQAWREGGVCVGGDAVPEPAAVKGAQPYGQWIFFLVFFLM